jgi:hypothetical protein
MDWQRGICVGKHDMRIDFAIVFLLALGPFQTTYAVAAEKPPNIILIFCFDELLKEAVTTLGNDDIRGSEQRDARTLSSSMPMTLKE